ncbi:MAG: arginine--tRNA ligase [Candidatus Pacebacteria bacterium]|nr:arginine--tRNA ligase [Candidatus Paceibacterota bacterium]
MLKKEIQKLIKKALEELKKEGVLKFDKELIEIERPKERRHGDYATNIALILAKKNKKNPIEIAKLIKKSIKNKEKGLFEKIEIKDGFINFFISKKYLCKLVDEIIKKGKGFGRTNLGKKKKTNIEFISANPTGPLHIGNGRGAFFGDVLANILEFAGFEVEREYYINNAKTNTQIQILGKAAMGKGRAYLSDYLKEKIKKLQGKLRRTKDERGAGYLLAREIQKDIKKFIEKKLKIRFDNWIEEESFYQKSEIKKTIKELKRRGLLYQKDGALWIKTSKFGEKKDWVVIRENDQPTYLMSDMVYHRDKIKRGFKKIINIWGADHQAHVSKMKATMKMLKFKGEFDVLISQIVTLKSGKKLSKRKGEIITLEELIDEVGLDVAKFFYLQKNLNTHMDFDLDLAREESLKNPVYYIQYAYVRANSILQKLKTQNSKLKTTTKSCAATSLLCATQNSKLFSHPKELELIKKLAIFPEIIEEIAQNYQVHRLTHYAKDLAGVFHQFYQECRVISKDEELTFLRMKLVLATEVVFENLLKLLGISLLKRM